MTFLSLICLISLFQWSRHNKVGLFILWVITFMFFIQYLTGETQ